MGICYDALRWPMEGSPQTLPRGLERKAVRKLRQPSVQIYVPFLVEFVGGTRTFHAGSGTVRRVPPFPIQPLTYPLTPEACLEQSYCPQHMGSTSSRAKIHFSRHPLRQHVRLWLLRYPENSLSISSLCVRPGAPEQHP